MEGLGDILIVVGLVSLSLLWVFSFVGGMHALWDTLGEHATDLIKKMRG